VKKLTTMLALGLLLAACGSTEAVGNSAFGDVTAQGSLAPLDNPANDPAVGQPAPTLTGVDRTGAEVAYTPGGGSPSLVVFLAHWCPHCQTDLPLLVDWLEANPDRLGINVTAVATGSDATRPNFPPGPWIEREGWDQPLIMDDRQSTAGRAFGLTSYPFWVVVDAGGNVLTRFGGALGASQIDALMQSIAAG
jgi:cytochrome c biogenesis protein CcmG, thiol:disulfide interchange protein DsbE